jgi:PAS domain S-box-containing protein
MYPDRQEVRFSQIHDSAWQAIQTDASGKQFLLKNGLFTYMDLQPKAAISGSSGGRWLLVTFVPAETFSANVAKRNNGLISVFILFALLVTIVSIVLAQKDVQRRQGEVRVRESEARFRALLDSAPDAIVIVDENGCITLVNSQTEKCFGYQRNELLGQPIERLVPERSRKRHKTERKEYIACPKARPMVAEPVLMGLRKDGSEFPVEISLSPLQTEHGLLVTSIVRDITARKEAELAKQQVEARYRTLVNNLPVGVYRNTPGNSGCFLEVNPAMVEIFEAKTTQELMAHSVSDLYCNPDDRKTFNDKMLQQGFVSAEEAHLKTLTGREFDAAITAVAKKDVAGQMYFDGIVEDISERKRTERQIQQLNDSLNFRSTELEAINQELEAFSYSVSHDLRTPLRAMDGFSRTLLKDYGNVLDEKGRDRLNRVRAAAQRMSELIDDLLKLSRVTRTEVKWESVDLSSCANNIADELRDGEPEREVEFLIQPDLNTHGDARLLQVVMSNLLGNAWKFTGLRNDAKIEVGAKVNGGGMTYYVRDNGAGFDMSYADKLFGAFQRLHDTNEFSGTGIGLATVQRVINKHGGKIWADSAVDEGATFYFNLGQGGNNERQGDFAG